MKKQTLPGFTAEASLYSRNGHSYKSGTAGRGAKPNSVIAANCASWARCCHQGHPWCCYQLAFHC
jgi:hypothetical protein